MTTFLAALTLAVCVALFARLLIGERARWRLDYEAKRAWQKCRSIALAAWRWPASRRRARHEADEAIRRARDGNGEWEGNVYKPDRFGKPRKPH